MQKETGEGSFKKMYLQRESRFEKHTFSICKGIHVLFKTFIVLFGKALQILFGDLFPSSLKATFWSMHERQI